MDNIYLNAISILTKGKIDALQKIHDHFEGDWLHAWHADLKRFLPEDSDYSFKNRLDPEQEYEKLVKAGIDMLTIYDNNYPALLKQIHNPPFLLYVRGSTSVLNSLCFSVVGTRALTEYGRRASAHIVEELASQGFTIVSGLAAGIDTQAHKAALTAKTPTIAVLGCGIDDRTIFPSQNVNLAHQIIREGGAVISEYHYAMHATRFTFPQRNRIVSGLSKGLLVVEADVASGSLITANCALEQNRDVFAIPGSIFSKTSQGTNGLIKSGAKMVMNSQDILEEYTMGVVVAKKSQVTPDNAQEAQILPLLSDEPLTINEIIQKSGLETSQVNATMVMMEIKNKIKNLGNERYVLI